MRLRRSPSPLQSGQYAPVGGLPFDLSRGDLDRVDWWLLRDSFVHQVDQPELLEKTVTELRELGYTVQELNATTWSPDTAHADLAAAWSFPDYYGRGLDALHDVLGEVALRERAVQVGSIGTVLVIRSFDRFQERRQDLAQGILDAWATRARTALVVGHPMILLIEAPETVEFDRVGGTPVVHFRRRPRLE